MSEASLRERLGAAFWVWIVVLPVMGTTVELVLEPTTLLVTTFSRASFFLLLAASGAVTVAVVPPRVREWRLVGFWITATVGPILADRLLGPPEGLAGHPLFVLDAVLAVGGALALSAAFWYRILPDEPLADTPLGD